MKRLMVIFIALLIMTSSAFAATGSLNLRKVSYKSGTLTFTPIKTETWSSSWYRKKNVAKEELNDYMCDKGILKYRGSWQPNTYKVDFTHTYKFLFSTEKHYYEKTYKYWVGDPYYKSKVVNGKRYYKCCSKTPLAKNKNKYKCSKKGTWSIYSSNGSFKFKV